MKCLRKIQHFDETAKWINKEETLFELTLSTYPELDEIKASCCFLNNFINMCMCMHVHIKHCVRQGSYKNVC